MFQKWIEEWIYITIEFVHELLCLYIYIGKFVSINVFYGLSLDDDYCQWLWWWWGSFTQCLCLLRVLFAIRNTNIIFVYTFIYEWKKDKKNFKSFVIYNYGSFFSTFSCFFVLRPWHIRLEVCFSISNIPSTYVCISSVLFVVFCVVIFCH